MHLVITFMLAIPQSLAGFTVALRRVAVIICATSGKWDYREHGPKRHQLGRQRQPINITLEIAVSS
ncbi:hypothetical protein TIFTF001_021645 [Ficus carica]|uniref:Secreted protein n=1 Tax=Ficus carica TaxID=3494 RepID=A0AA88AKR6_FICCA|nr:hypothetical protein TIFTF001_021645 [Ficus carica]